MQDDRTTKWFERNGLVPPSSTSHGVTEDNIRDKLEKANVQSWRLEGNKLIAKTDIGELVNVIDPAYILKGVDARGLPILEKV